MSIFVTFRNSTLQLTHSKRPFKFLALKLFLLFWRISKSSSNRKVRWLLNGRQDTEQEVHQST